MQFKIRDHRRRLFNITKKLKNPWFADFSKQVNDVTSKSILQQIRTQCLPPRARRYTLDEKLMALSVMKTSGECYRLLSKIFALPSRRTLTNLVNHVSFGPGINDQIFKSLQAAVEKMNPLDRFCIILCDELAIDSTVSYNKKQDIVEGLEDSGESRKIKLADHANLIMVKGWLSIVSGNSHLLSCLPVVLSSQGPFRSKSEI